jgi:cytochrome P450
MKLDEFDPFDPGFLSDPAPWLSLLRKEAPVFEVPRRGYWVVTRYADVRKALRDHESFSSAKGNAPEPGWQPGIIAKDPPDHTRLRNITKGVFTPKAIERRWGGRVAAICDELVDRAVKEGTVDGYRALTLPLPIQVIAEMLGIPDGDLSEFKRWSDDMCEGVTSHLDAGVRARSEQAFASLLGYFKQKVGERRARPEDDLITLICQAGEEDRLTDKEVIHFLILLLIAGNETTTNLIGNGLLALMRNPAEEAKLRARPELLENAVEEMLRYCPSTQSVFRHSTREVEVRGHTIPKDKRVMLHLAAANRDEEQYPEPEVFRVDREVNEHLAFSSGIHACLGVALARLESRSMLSALLARTRELRLVGEPEMLSTIVVRGPVRIPMQLVSR